MGPPRPPGASTSHAGYISAPTNCTLVATHTIDAAPRQLVARSAGRNLRKTRRAANRVRACTIHLVVLLYALHHGRATIESRPRLPPPRPMVLHRRAPIGALLFARPTNNITGSFLCHENSCSNHRAGTLISLASSLLPPAVTEITFFPTWAWTDIHRNNRCGPPFGAGRIGYETDVKITVRFR